MILTALLFSQLVTSCAPGDSAATLAAVAKVESGFNTLAINDNTARQHYAFDDLANAIATANSHLAEGHSLDLGLMQINSRNLPNLGMSVSDAFDACQSIRAGAQVLRTGFQSALRIAFSRYNTGSDTRGFSNGYVAKVMSSGGIPDIAGHLGDSNTRAIQSSNSAARQLPSEPHELTDILHGADAQRTHHASEHRLRDLFSDHAATSGKDEKTPRIVDESSMREWK